MKPISTSCQMLHLHLLCGQYYYYHHHHHHHLFHRHRRCSSADSLGGRRARASPSSSSSSSSLFLSFLSLCMHVCMYVSLSGGGWQAVCMEMHSILCDPWQRHACMRERHTEWYVQRMVDIWMIMNGSGDAWFVLVKE